MGLHHQLDRQEFEQAPGAGDGQGTQVCCSPWSCKELDMTQLILVSNFYLFKPGHFMSLIIVCHREEN